MGYQIQDDPPVCLNCGETLYGRTDKKFCNATCKNNFHNMETRHFKLGCRIFEEKLRRNHIILESLLQTGMNSAQKSRLEEAGFDPGVTSGVVMQKNRQMEFICLDIIYRMTEKKVFNIRKVSPSAHPSSRR